MVDKSEVQKQFPEAEETKSGLMYIVHETGEGEPPKQGTRCTVHYTGKLLDGTKFDSSVDRNDPFQFHVGVREVIDGWDEAFLTMKKGEKRTLILPPDLAYGSAGAGADIPPNSWLVFDVEMIDF